MPDPIQIAAAYENTGYFFPIRGMSSNRAQGYRRELEAIEKRARQNPEDINANIRNLCRCGTYVRIR